MRSKARGRGHDHATRAARALGPTGLLIALSALSAACGTSGDAASTAAATGATDSGSPSATREGGIHPGQSDAAGGSADAASDAAAPGVPCPTNATWSSLIPGPGQAGHDATLATAVAKFDRLHEALVTRATGLAGSITVSTDAAARQKLAHLLATPWAANDTDPTDDLMQYESLEPTSFVTGWGMSTGMYAGSEIAADAFRYAVLRDRGGDCTELARARKMLEDALDALHVVMSIPGSPGGVARSIARADLPGDGKAPLTPLFDSKGAPLPAEKSNGTWRADNSVGSAYPNMVWLDSCSRDMIFGWTFGAASAWEVIEKDPSFDQSKKDRLRADAKNVLDGLRVVRSSGRDLEIYDPDGRRTVHGNLHESSVDRTYVLQNGPASMMALGQVAGLASIVGDASSKAYLQTLITARGLPGATNQSMFVIALGGDQSNHSSFNMLFVTAWMAQRYIDDASVRTKLKKPTETDLYAPLLGARPVDWKQSFFDLVNAASTGGAWLHGAAKPPFDVAAVARATDTLSRYPAAPFYANNVENCDATEVASGSCLLNDGVTFVSLKTTKWGVIGDKPVPMNHRPPSNWFWRTDPFIVNGTGNPDVIFPGSDLRSSYWMGRYVRVAP